MAKNPMDGTRQVLVELPEGLVQEVEAFARSRGLTLGDVTVEALKRHMASPPPVPAPSGAAPAPPPASDLINADKVRESEQANFDTLAARADAAQAEEEGKADGGRPKKSAHGGTPEERR